MSTSKRTIDHTTIRQELFDKFDEKRLAFLYQETTAFGGKSRFDRFVER